MNNETITIATGIVAIITTFVGVTWKLSEQKAEILKLLNIEMKAIASSLEGIKYTLGIQATEVQKEQSIFDLRIKNLEEKFKSNLRQVYQELKEIEEYLQMQSDFKIRKRQDKLEDIDD